MLPIQRLNKILAETYRRAQLAVSKRGAQNKTAKTKGYDNNDNFGVSVLGLDRNKVTFAYNAGIPKNKKVVIDNLDVISSQAVAKKEAVEEYKELDKSYNYEYFQISRRDGFCAILRIGVLKGSTTESLREKNKRISATRKSSGSAKSERYTAHMVVLTYGAVWEPEIIESQAGARIASLEFNEANWNKLFTPGFVDPNNRAFSNPGSLTSVRFWEKSSVNANGIGSSGVGISEFALDYKDYEGSGSLYPAFDMPSNPLQFVVDLHKGVCDFSYIRENTSSSQIADTKFSVISETGGSHQKLFTSSASGGFPDDFGEMSFAAYERYTLGNYSYIDAQISFGGPVAIDRDQILVSSEQHLVSYSDGSSEFLAQREFSVNLSIYPRGFTTELSSLYSFLVRSKGVGQSKTKLALVLDGRDKSEYVAKQDVTDPSLAGPSNFYASNVFVLPEFSVEVHGEKLWLNYYTTVSNNNRLSRVEANRLIWSGWNSPSQVYSFTDPYFETPSTTNANQKIFYVIEDNSGAKNDQKLCKWCLMEKTSSTEVTYRWMKGELESFKNNPFDLTTEVKSKAFTIPISTDTNYPEREYIVSDGTGYLSDTFYSSLTGGLLPLLRYAESSYTLLDQTSLTVKLSADGDLFICKTNPNKDLKSTDFDPLTTNGTPLQLIPFSIANIAERLELPDTPIFVFKYRGDPQLFNTMPLEIQTIPSSARSIANMYFDPKNYNLTASLGIVSLGTPQINNITDDSQVSIDQYTSASTAQRLLNNYYYR